MDNDTRAVKDIPTYGQYAMKCAEVNQLQAKIEELEGKAYWKEISDIQADEYRDELEAKVEALETALNIDALQATITELNAERGNFNTFWACKEHSNNASLRCAICDENKIIELEAKVESLQAKVEEQRKHINIMATALSEIKATDDGNSGQEIGTILGWSIEQIAALKQESG